MELKEKITLDMLTKDSVSVLRQQFLTFNGEEMQVGGNIRNAYMNSKSGREQLKTVLSDFDMEILSVDPIEYRCYCSRERTERALLSLGSKELEDILREQGKTDLTCRFCDRIHSFSGEELRRMIDELKKIGK